MHGWTLRKVPVSLLIAQTIHEMQKETVWQLKVELMYAKVSFPSRIVLFTMWLDGCGAFHPPTAPLFQGCV